MGKATITGGGTNGLYTVSVDYGVALRFQLMTPLQDRVGKLDIQIAEQEAIVSAAADKVAVAISAADVAISAYAQAQQEFPEQDHTGLAAEATAAVENVILARGEDSKARILLTFMKAERKQLQDRISALQSAVMTETRQAWCATLVDDATGDVATAEIPGEPQSILIAPDAPAWNLTQHGQLLAREVMSPEQAFWNAAVLPGWQKWMPTYRKGTITALNKSTSLASVALDAATSSAAGLGVNRSSSLSNVPVVYMTCNAEVFEVGNRVVVEFVGMVQESPRVIGFVSNPKSCSFVFLTISVGHNQYAPSDGCEFNQTSSPQIVGSNGISGSLISVKIYKGETVEFTATTVGADGFILMGWSTGETSPTKSFANIIEATHIQALYFKIATAIPVSRIYFATFFPHPTNPSLIGPPSWVIYLDVCAVIPALPCSTQTVVSHDYLQIARGDESYPDINIRPSGPATVQHSQTIGSLFTYSGPVSYARSGVYNGLAIEMYARAG